MSDEKKICWSGLTVSFFSGLLLGAGVALLFTPITGKDARKSIVDEFDELKSKLKKLEEKF